MGLKTLISNLEAGTSISDVGYPNHDTPSEYAGANYGNSKSIFDNQVFRQRSLGYGPQGSDIEGGAFFRVSEPEPFITQNLPGLEETRGSGFLGALDTVSNVGVRGGLITATTRSAIDAARIGKFLISARGIGFIAKNVGLQRSNPKLQENAPAIGRNRVYNLGVNTLAQTLVNFGGLHVNRAGLLPIGPNNYLVEQGYRVDTDNKTKYEYNVRGTEIYIEGGTGNITNLTDVYKGNRLASLFNKLIANGAGEAGFNDVYNTEPELYEFSGGPHSVYGIGKTRLKRYTFSSRDAIDKIDMIRKDTSTYLNSRRLGKMNGSKPTDAHHIVDFRKVKNEGAADIQTGHTNYDQKVNGRRIQQLYGYPGGYLVQKFGAGAAGGQTFPNNPQNPDGTINLRFKKDINGYEKFLVDQINHADIIRHEGSFDSTDVAKNSKDYIKFRIEAVDADKPTQSDTMVFRAFLDAMDDSYDSQWNEFNYNGRSEPFFTFGSFNRSISFSFKVAAFSREEMKPLYRKLNFLVSQTAGDYSKTRLRGNFCRLTIGDYFSRVPGFFTSIKLAWNTDYPWEIALNTNGLGHNQDDDMNELPHILNVQCSYQPVHDFIPKKSVTDSPFILPNKYSKTNITDEQTWLKEGAFDQISATAEAEKKQKEQEEAEKAEKLKAEKFTEEAQNCEADGGVWTWVDEAYPELGGSCKSGDEIIDELQEAFPDDDEPLDIEEEDELEPWELPEDDPNFIPNPLGSPPTLPTP